MFSQVDSKEKKDNGKTISDWVQKVSFQTTFNHFKENSYQHEFDSDITTYRRVDLGSQNIIIHSSF